MNNDNVQVGRAEERLQGRQICGVFFSYANVNNKLNNEIDDICLSNGKF